MDIGGVWNGTSEVTATTGDTFQFTVCSNGADTVQSATATATLPAHFSYVAGTVNGLAGVTAAAAGSVVTFSFPSGISLPNGTCATVGYGLTVDATETAGTYTVNYNVNYSSTTDGSGTAGSLPFLQNVLVQAGASTISKGPANQSIAVGGPVSWAVTVTNTGGGGLFNVSVNEAAINPTNASNSIAFTSMTQLSPGAPSATGAGSLFTLPYLSPGQSYIESVAATVTGCLNLNNTASTNDRTGSTSGSASTQVLLDFLTPLVAFTAPAIVLNNLASTPVSIPISNTGHGDARNAVLATTLASFPVTVSGVSAGWSYDVVSGSFTKTANGGTISNMSAETLSFTIAPSAAGQCTPPGAGLYFVTGNYADVCGNPYANPVSFANLSASYTQPKVALAIAAPASITAPTNNVVSTVTVTITRPDLISSNPIVVVDTLPVNVGSISIGALSGGQTATCSGPCLPGSALNWSIPNPGGSATQVYNLYITYSVPSVTCSDGQFSVDAATMSVLDSVACQDSASASASSVLINTVSTNVTTGYAESYSIGAGSHETGLTDNGNGVRDPGEGAFIPISSTYTFPAAYAGTWSGSSYSDNFGGLSTMTLVPNSLKVSWDGGAAVPVPSANVTQFIGGLGFSVGFLAGPSYVNSASVGGHTVSFTYEATATDDVLSGASSPAWTDTVNHFSDFVVAGASGACTGSSTTRIIQYGADTLTRAVENLTIAMPSVIDVCQTFTATATVVGANFNAYKTSETVVTGSSYTYVTGQTPVDTGLFSGNLTYSENGGVYPTFTYVQPNLLGTGTFGVLMRRKASAGTNNAAVGVTGAYDDWQLNPYAPPGAPLSLSATASPTSTQKGGLVLTATPQAISVTGNQVQWVIYANNTKSGGIYNLTLADTLPAGLTIDVSSTNLQNPNYPVTVNATSATWSTLNGVSPINIAEGAGIAITVVADVAGNTCSIPGGALAEEGKWGCDGSSAEDILNTNPTFTFPTGTIQAVHDSVNTFTELCSFNYDTMILRNTGLPYVYNAQMQEILNPLTTGIDIVANSVQVSTNGGTTWTALGASGNPTGDGSAGNPYTWTTTQVPQLASIAPFGTPGAYSNVQLRVEISAAESSDGPQPSVTTKATANTACGAAVADLGTPFSLLLNRPDIAVTKVGKNVTEGQSSFSSTVYGAVGDQIVWQITVKNNNPPSGTGVSTEAFHVRLLDNLPSDGGTATVSGPGITGTPPITSGVTVGISSLTALGTAVYTVTETLGSSCVSSVNTANVSWGCTENPAGQISDLNTPGTSTATAGLVMIPQFVNGTSTVTFSALAGGRALVTIDYANTGGTAQNILIYSTVPAGMQLDATSTPTFTTNGAVTAMTSIGTLASPAYAFTGSLNNGTNVQLSYTVIQTGNFDVTTSSYNFPDSFAKGTDPALPAGGALPAEIDFMNTCLTPGQQTIVGSLNPPTPNLDVTMTPAFSTATAGTPLNLVFSIVNVGQPLSVANNFTFALTGVGGGWTVNSVTISAPGSGGTGGTCAGGSSALCSSAQLGTLAYNTTATITVNATPTDNGLPLTIQGLVTGTLFTTNGTNTGNTYSFDAAAPKTVGVTVTKSLLSTSEPATSTGTLEIGEEATFNLNVHWFGGSNVSGITVRDTLPSGLGFVSFSTAAPHDQPIPVQSGVAVTPVNSGVLNLTIPDFVANDGTFNVNLVARALNVGGNVSGLTQSNNLDVQFNSNGQSFASNAPTGFGGNLPALNSSTTTTIGRPILTMTKQVENLTSGTVYGATGNGVGGDTLQYKVVVTNTGTAPAYDITVADALASSKLLMIAGSGGTFVAGAGGSVTYNNGNFAGNNLGEMDPGQSSTMTYQAQIDVTASPNDTLFNGATFYAGSLSGLTGHESQNQGAPGATTGETLFTGSQSVPVTVSSISFTKSLTATSLGFVSTNVVVGEQVQFTLALVMPAGDTNGLNIYDQIPAGLSLIQTPAVSLGAAVTASAPTITPGVLPAAGAVHAIWSFPGTVAVASNTSPGVPTTNLQRTITINYLAQVEDIAGVIDGTTLVNGSSYTYIGSPPANLSSVTLGVNESSGAVAVALNPTTNVVAGTVVVATITVTNAGHATADDMTVAVLLPPGLTYVPGTTIDITGFAGLGEPDVSVSGSTLTFGFDQATPQVIAVTTTTAFKFQINLLAGAGVQPNQPQPVKVYDNWTSLPAAAGTNGPNLGVLLTGPGTTLGERVGGSLPNKYDGVASATTTAANLFTVVKSSAPGSNPDGSYRLGDVVSYEIQANFQPGTVQTAQIFDILPAGLEFVSQTSLSPSSGTGNFAYTVAAAPVANSTGAIAWTLTNVTNSGAASAPLTLLYTVQAFPSGTGTLPNSPSKAKLINAANLRYTSFNGSLLTSLTSGATAFVEQPSLTFAKILQAGQATTVTEGSPVNYQVTVTNGGAGPAYDVAVQDTLPVGLRAATPVVSSATLNGIGITPLTNLAQTYNAGTGVVNWTLTDAQVLNGSVVGATETLKILYAATVDAGEGAGLTLTNNALVTQSFSLPADGGRSYGASASSAATVVTPLPTGISKLVSTFTATIGASPAYTITFPTTTVGVALYKVRLLDTIPASLTGLVYSNNAASLTPGVCGSIVVTDNSVGNALDISYSCLPPGTQAVVTATATVADVSGNAIGNVISNTASYAFAQTSGGSDGASVSTTVATTIIEPQLELSKVFLSSAEAHPAMGLQAGDAVTYRIKVANGSGVNVASAYNLLINDISDQNLTAPSVTADPNNPGAPSSLGVVGGNSIYQWSVPGPLAPGATYQFDVTFTLGPNVQPNETLLNFSSVTWTSLPGGGRNDTGGSTAPDNYVAQATATVAIVVGPAHMEKSIKVPGGTTYEIGQPVTYHLPLTFGQGIVNSVNVIDTLPANVVYDSVVLTPTNVQVNGGGAVTILSGPSAGATGVLTFSLGNLQSTGANPEVDLDVTVHPNTNGANVAGTALTNAVRATVVSSTGGVVGVNPLNGLPTITIIEPNLTLTKALATGQPTTVLAGGAVNYVVTAANGGAGIAYDVQVQDTLPVGMRNITPVVSSATLNGVGISPLTNLAQTYNTGTGVVQWTLTDSQILNASIVGSTESLKIFYTAQVDASEGAGLSLSNSALVQQYFSQPSTAGTRRQYGPTAPQTTTVNTPPPAGIGKTVTLAQAAIGAQPAYAIVVPTTTIGVALYNVRIQDTIPAGLSAPIHSNNAASIAAGACGTINVTDNSVGNALDISYSCLPPGTQAVVFATATVSDIAGNHAATVISNSASYTWTQTSGGSVQPSVSTSGITTTVVEPVLAITKVFLSSSEANPAAGLEAGDNVTYRIKVVNGLGANVSPAYNLAIYDIADQNLTSPVTTADPNNPGVPTSLGTFGGNGQYVWNVAGPLAVGATYQFDVTFTLGSGVQPMQTLVNTSSVTWTSLAPAGGAGVGQRDGSGGVNNYDAVNAAPVSVIAGPVHMEKSIKAPGGTTYEIGQAVTYHLPFTFAEGTVDGVNVQDLLPSGMAYDSVVLTPINTQKAGGGAVAIVSGPSAGATGTLTFNLGNLQSTSANPEVDLDVTAHATTAGGNVAGTALTNGVEALVTSSTGGVVGIPPMNGVPTITLIEPNLTLTKALGTGQPTTVLAGGAVNYVVTAANGGAGIAYDVQVQDTLPVGMRNATPVVTAATLNGVAIAPLTNLAQTYTAATGVVQWTLTDSQILNASVVGSTESLVISYTAQVDAAEGAGLSLSNSALVQQYFSQPSTAGTRRQYGPTAPQTTTIHTPAPAGIGKTVTLAQAAIGAQPAYAIVVPTTTIGVALYNVRIQDVIPAGLSAPVHSNNAASIAPGSCGAINVTDNTVGNNLDISYSCLPPGTQAVVFATATVSDIGGNIRGTSISNSASYTWTQTSGGSVQPAVSTSGITTSVIEPVLAITKVFLSSAEANPAAGLEAGDNVTYRIKVVNGLGANVAPAYNLAIYDIADQNLISPSVTADPDNPGLPTSLGTFGGNGQYVWNVAGPLAVGATYQFDVTFTLGSGVQPMQTLVNASSVTWTSLAPAGGAGVGQRDGSGGVNNYDAVNAAPVSITVGPAHIEKAIKSPGGSTYAVGQTAVYRLDFSFAQGDVSGVHVLDALPAGLIYSAVAVSTSNAQALGGGAVTLLSGPSAGATGLLNFNLGALQSSGSSPTVHVDVSAVVANVGGNVNGTLLTNGVSAALTSSTGGVVGVSPLNPLPVITVTEPSLVLAHDGPAGDLIDLGKISTFTVRTENFGTAAAYQPTVVVQLGAGMRAASPASRTTTAVIGGGRALTLVSGTDYTLSYSSTTGNLNFVFTTSVAYVAVGETLTLTYDASVDNNAVNATVLDSTAAVTQYYSQDTSAGVGANTRLYANSFAASAGHDADGAALLAGFNFGDDAPVTVRAPVLNVVKSVTPFSAILPQNTTLTWGLSIANAGPIPSAASVLSDDLGAYAPTNADITSASLSTVTVVGAGGAYVDSSSPSGGTASKGLVSLSGLIIPAASTVTVTFSVGISSVIPNGTKIYNRANLTVPGFTSTFISFSNRTADGAGPTAATINSIPGFYFYKTAAVVGGGALVDGSTITYTMSIRNQGTERSLSSVLTDGIPANTKYVPGTTTLNGAPVADVFGQSAMSSGMSVNSPGETSGILDVYTGVGEADVTFQVRVDTGVPAGSAISNQGQLTGLGEGTGTPISKLSDDPTTVPSPDPTVLIVSGGPYLLSEKTSSIDVGPALLDSGTLTYTIAVRNLGNVAAAKVVLTDPIPANSTYVAGSLRFGVGLSTAIATTALTDAADGDVGDYNVTTASAVTVNIGTVPANGQASIVFRVQAPAAAPNGTVIANQASISAPSLPTILSDGDGDHSNGSQPTYNVVGATGAAVLIQTKKVTALNGGIVNPGDPLQYLITTTNVGNSTATNVVVTDTGPWANANYSTGTTQLNGVTLADAGLISPLVAGYNIGSLNPGQSQIITYKVRVSTLAGAGANVDNAASFAAAGPITGSSCSDRSDCLTRVEVGGTPGSAAVSGRVWLDLLHNRIYTAGTDQPQPNWTVQVLLGGTVVGTAKSAVDGTYSVAGLSPGTGYQIRFLDPTTGVVYGQAISSSSGAVTSDGTIRNLTLNSGDNLLNQSLPLDPNGVIYDSITRQPIAGAQVFLLGPAGYNPALHLLPGQNGQITDASGLYRFDINFGAGAPLGVYTLSMATPPGYLSNLPNAPSTLIAPSTSSLTCAQTACLAVPVPPAADPDLIQAQNTAPAVGQPTPYYLRFDYTAIPASAVVNNHIPLDPVLSNAIFVTKTAHVVDVSKGDLVAYTITARNTVATQLTNINLVDLLPPGFSYRSGSANLNGVSTPPLAAGRNLTWTGLTFAIGETKTFNLLLTVGSGVGYGQYVNQAWAVNTLVNSVVSNVAAATVRVQPDPTLDCTDVIGKVFDDVNANGYQDEGEPGLPNVRVVTARGWLIDTDSQGRFHIACAIVPNQDRGSNFVMKLDEKTLPTGYRVTTENPRSIRATSGKFARIDFGAALFHVVRLDLSNAAFHNARSTQPAPAPPEPTITWDVVLDSAAIPPLRFNVAKFEITPEHLTIIHDALERVRAMKDVRDVRLQIVGHTDATPIAGKLRETIPDNWALSRSRAAATAVLLREKLDLPENMIITDGEADTQPVADDATPEGRALNRRVEIQVLYRKKVVHEAQAAIRPGVDAPSSAWAAWEKDERPPWKRALDRLIDALDAKPSVLRLGYCRGPGEKIEEARFRVWQVSNEVRRVWKSKPDRYALTIEEEVDGAACSGKAP